MAASAAVKPPTIVLLGQHPAVVLGRLSWGATAAGNFVSRGRSAVPAHHVSGIPRCGINGSYRWWSSHRPGPGASQASLPCSHVWKVLDRARTTPRGNRVVGRPAPHTLAKARGISVEHGSPIYCATTSQGVFQRAVSGTRYTLSDSQVSDPANLFFLAVPRTLGHTLCTWPRSCFWAFCPGPPNLTQRSRQTPTTDHYTNLSRSLRHSRLLFLSPCLLTY